MRFLLLFLSVITLISCNRTPQQNYWVEKINAEELSRVILTYANELKHEKRMRLEDSKVSYKDHIHIIHMEFISQDILELKEARELLVDIVEGFLDRLNDDPYLERDSEGPITADNLEIYVNFQSYFGEYDDQFYVGWMGLNNGSSYFYAFDIKQFEEIDWWHYRSEWYYKSRQFVEIERAAEEGYQAAHPADEAQTITEFNSTPKARKFNTIVPNTGIPHYAPNPNVPNPNIPNPNIPNPNSPNPNSPNSKSQVPSSFRPLLSS